MRSLWIWASVALLLALSAVAQEPTAQMVTVNFVQPNRFTDVDVRRTYSRPDRNPHLHSLRKYLESRATRYLANGQSLRIDFTDIDLAGDFEPQIDPALHDVRIVSRLYPPRLKFNYSLRSADGATLKLGEADLRDLAFDFGTSGNTSDALRFEKRMLAKWMKQELGG